MREYLSTIVHICALEYWLLKLKRGYALLFFLYFIFISGGLNAQEKKSSVRFSGIPALGFGPDSGFGFGAVGNMYVDEEGFVPYRTSLGLKIYLSTKGMNSHSLLLDQIAAFNMPLRLTSRVGFFSTISQNYCGINDSFSCDENQALLAANLSGLSGNQRANFIKHYYQHRFMTFFGDVFARWLLWQDDAKLELITSYRGRYYLNRDFKNRGPYLNSLYDRDFHKEKTEGYLSSLEIGLMLDKRDNEPAPTSGYWLEASLRGGSWLIGSAWDYFAQNVSARFYFPLEQSHCLVIASQTIFDTSFGNLPFDAISHIGGSQSLSDFTAIGGQYLGRGIREQRYVGRIKAIEQAEFRYTFFSFELFKQNFDLTLATFADFSMTSWDFSRFTKDMKNIYTGFGGGLRIHWNKTFIVRGDLGLSPSENFSPKFYLVVGNVF